MASGDLASLRALGELLGAAEEGADAEEAAPSRPALTPASIGAAKARDPKAIWAPDEIPADADDDEAELEEEAAELEELAAAGLKVPECEFVLRQAIGVQEGYGMALDPMAKDPGSASCETLVVRVALPGVESAAGLDLDVTARRVRLRGSGYALSAPLPEAVDADGGSARFDAAKATLELTLPIVREGEAVIMA